MLYKMMEVSLLNSIQLNNYQEENLCNKINSSSNSHLYISHRYYHHHLNIRIAIAVKIVQTFSKINDKVINLFWLKLILVLIPNKIII